jgi:nitrogen regulatory protein PII-like uncharacterized protein
MAITDIVLSGKVRTDAGAGVSGATVSLLETAVDLDGEAESGATDTTDSDGTWSITETTITENYDVKIVKGDSKRYLAWSDEIALKGVDTASLKIRGAASAAAPLYFFASAAGANEDIWTVKAADGGAFTFESFASGSSVAQLTINPNSTVASSSVVFPGILDVNGSVDWDVTDVQVDSSGDIDLVSSYDAAAAIYLHQSTGTSGTIKIHADTGTSVTEGAESINILSDAGGVGIRSTANLAKAVNITSDGGTTGSIAIFNDQGTSVTEGAESISLLSDAGGVGIRSTANLANAVNITVDGGSTSSMTLFNDQGTSVTEGAESIAILSDVGGVGIRSTANLAKAVNITSDGGTTGSIAIFNDQGTSVTEGAESISLLSDAGGIGIRSTADLANAVNLTVDGGTSSTMTLFNDQGTAATEGAASIQLLSDVGGINIKSGLNGANAILLTADGGTSETIVLHADQGTSESSIQLLSDAGGVDINAATGKDVDIAGGTVNLTSSDDAASAIYLRANAGTSETIKIHADQGTGAASISAVSDVGGITLDAGLDIALSADGGNVTMDDGTTTIFDFDVDGTALTIHDDQDTGDKAVITMAQHGALTIVTTDDDAAAANIQITADGTAELAGTTVTLDSAADIELEATDDINIPASVGLTFGDDGEKIEGDGTNLVVASSGTLDMNSGGVLTLDSGAAINIEPAGGSAILLDGTISVDAGVVTGATSLTIGDTVITDGLITDSTGLKFTADVSFGTTNTNQDVNFYGVNTDRDMSWDAGNNALLIKDNAALYLGNGTDLQLYHGSDVSHIRGVNYPLQVNLNGGDLSNIGDMEIDASKTITGSGDLTIDTVGNLLLDGGNDTVLMNSGATICIVDDVGLRLSADTAHADTAGTNIISLFNGTAPAGTLSNGASFFCASGEMKVIDAAGNVTVLSPHDDDGEWVFHSHDNSGKVIHIQMERMMKRLDEMLGGGFIEEYIED